ncbi:MAG: c-type cytochrome [Marinobacter sp.]|uniref:c-type cytochrome n=1 Tax=Marinobacter sp. TaxID=50741 RepID=UPI00299EFF6D|nr:c-type cytochrome [Marinobacter sp.]MDX1633228.1 c-type cytochrome [Marinobacter sp.]
MKTVKILAAVLLGISLSAGVALAAVEDQIRARIQPVGEVCVEGEECEGVQTAAAPASAPAEPRGGEEVYAAVCQACHNTGAAGAPKITAASDWEGRLDKGMETLVDHAINGIGAMPAKGGCANCPDEEIRSAVEYMVSEVEG